MERHSHTCRLEDFILSECSYTPNKAIYRPNAILIKIPVAFFFVKIEKNSKVHMNSQGNLYIQNNLEEQSWKTQTS